jgi:hypothetical protein
MPTQYEPLFICGSDIRTQACISAMGIPEFAIFGKGYKDAADQLVRAMHNTSYGRDSVVYPIVFLYRHYFEQRFKNIIISGARILDGEWHKPDGHRLMKLWEQAKLKIINAWQELAATPPELAFIDHIVNEFEKADPGSFSIRYPTVRGTWKSPLDNLKHINLSHLAQQVDEASHSPRRIVRGTRRARTSQN